MSKVSKSTLWRKSGFTLAELLIVIALIVITTVIALMVLNPVAQLAKGRDVKRKGELSLFRKALEDWYNDKNCYPKPEEVCYPGLDNGDPVTANPCYICGHEEKSPSLVPYLSSIPCDPQHPSKRYLYEAEKSDCPKWYRLYTKFSSENDPEAANSGCYKNGCGPRLTYGYDYGVSSPNIGLEITNSFYCPTRESSCDGCGTPENCADAAQRGACNKPFYGSYAACCEAKKFLSCTFQFCYTPSSECVNCGYPDQCQSKKLQGVCTTIYATLGNCCLKHPTAGGCK